MHHARGRALSGAALLLLTLAAPSPSRPAAPRVDTLLQGLEMPWALAGAPDGRPFVTERPGRAALRGLLARRGRKAWR